MDPSSILPHLTQDGHSPNTEAPKGHATQSMEGGTNSEEETASTSAAAPTTYAEPSAIDTGTLFSFASVVCGHCLIKIYVHLGEM